MTPSKNAVAQALKIIADDIGIELTKRKFFQLLKTPMTRMSTARYWEGRYNIKSWGLRSLEGRIAAMIEAVKILYEN